MQNWKNGEIRFFENALPISLIQKIKELPAEVRKHKLNISSWEPNVVGMSGPILIYDIEDELRKELIHHVCKLEPELCNEEESGWITFLALGGRFSYIPWHDDGCYRWTVTIYINDNWHEDYGGFFIYKTQDGIRAELPRFNRASIFKPPIRHTTTMPNMIAPLRESIQIFVGKKEGML